MCDHHGKCFTVYVSFKCCLSRICLFRIGLFIVTLKVSRVQALCFDVDGTLRDTDDQYVMNLANWLRPLRFVLPRRDPHAFARLLVMKLESPAGFMFRIPDRLGFDGYLTSLNDFLYRSGIRSTEGDYVIIDGVQETLAVLSRHYPLAVVSNRRGGSTTAFLDAFHLRRYFQCVVTGKTLRKRKPHPEPLLWAADQMGVPADGCLMIGDTTVDIQAGKAAGAQAVGLLCGFGERDELQRTGADLILDSPVQLVDILLG